MAEILTEDQTSVADAGVEVLEAQKLPRPGTIGVIPGTATRIEYRKNGGTVINHGLPPGGHSGVVKRFLRLNPPKTNDGTSRAGRS